MAMSLQSKGGTTAATRRYKANDQRPWSIGDNPMTKVEYDGDNPLRLANEIETALAKHGSGSDHRMCKAIYFFEGELRLIAECLRCAGPPKVANQPPSTHGVATREEIEKSLKQVKKMQIIFLPGTLSAWKSAGNRQSVPVPRSESPIDEAETPTIRPRPPGLQAALQVLLPR